MFQAFRDVAPTMLIPAAWLVAGGAHAELLSTDGLLIAHIVMAAFITLFVLTGWHAMDTGALRAWRIVLVAGFFLTLSGIAGFSLTEFETPLLAISLIGWMLLPAVGLAATGDALVETGFHPVYHGGAGLSVIGAGLYVSGLAIGVALLLFVGMAFVGIGQTAGIVDAARRD